MSEQLIISVSREYGSGGHEIAVKTANQLGIKVYERELIRLACEYGELSEKAMSAARDDATIRELAHSRKQNRCHRHLTQAFHLPSQDPLPKGHGILSSS